jgi:dTDP-glucose 4,6-dehydratase
MSFAPSPAQASVREDARQVLKGRTQRLEPLRGKHLFLTGGTGFLGTWLLELLAVLNQDHAWQTRVTILTRDGPAFASRLPHLATQPWLHVQEGDVRYLAELPADTRFVLHAAATTDRRSFATHPSLVADTNINGTARALKACLLLEHLEKFLLVSSGLVYGAQPWDLPLVDEDFAGPLRCDTAAVYAESKRMAEVLAHAAASESKLPVVIVRPFAFVGPGQSLQLSWAVTDFMRDSLAGGPIRIMGDGSTVRSLMYASDFAFGVLVTLASGQARRTYNLGSDHPVDLLTLAQKIARFQPSPPTILTRLGKIGYERSRLVPDVTRIRRELDVKTTVPLDEALQKTVQWHRLAQT